MDYEKLFYRIIEEWKFRKALRKTTIPKIQVKEVVYEDKFQIFIFIEHVCVYRKGDLVKGGNKNIVFELAVFDIATFGMTSMYEFAKQNQENAS